MKPHDTRTTKIGIQSKPRTLKWTNNTMNLR